MNITIRPVNQSDLNALVTILNHYISKTAVTFDTQTYTAETRMPWFSQFAETGRHQCLVAEADNGQILGYANSGTLRPKAAYDTSVEVSVYTDHQNSVKGLGSKLYEALFLRLADEDVHRAHALITLPNDASVGLHRKFGFYDVGTLHEAGRKFDLYHSVLWMEKKLR
ncbi:GNAT family N-acetyltransferase [Reinekea blandensis]|uniref:Putative phosphinothricin N-acetyltransferase n=1 Tax=Reinekea blandensis MED297 TaxID=314283 RepID=A4BD82_9GAMM|nr:GNAT family N-acetyltransferase [Reinekea blandensis]EAR09826.1 putative phosphinothricin N-acetyltransferase [Reinekea sp. MED297] [Reinekea blandensis MED297]